jgi:hypothetical protein
MIELSFRDFFEHKWCSRSLHELYIMANGLGEILYIGISSQDIWDRWFGWNGHIIINPNCMIGESAIGQMIVDHLPNSWDWKIQFWTLKDCLKFCASDLNPHGKYDIKWVETIMIQKLRPSLNLTYNLNPRADHTPRSKRERQREEFLDKIYNDIFEKRSKN